MTAWGGIVSCDPCAGLIVELTDEVTRLRRLVATMAADSADPLPLVLDRDGSRWCAEVVGVRGSFSYGGNLTEATRRAKAAALRAMAAGVERGEESRADGLFSARGRLH